MDKFSTIINKINIYFMKTQKVLAIKQLQAKANINNTIDVQLSIYLPIYPLSIQYLAIYIHTIFDIES